MLERAKLAPKVEPRALAIFEALGRAEARVHGTELDAVHFHEVGAVDAIVDVTARPSGSRPSAIDRVSWSPVAIGHGTIESDHGLLPLPAPATLELIVGDADRARRRRVGDADPDRSGDPAHDRGRVSARFRP